MGQFVKVATRSELQGLTSGKFVEAAGKEIALFRVAGKYYAIGRACTHRGGPLSEGTLGGEQVTCPWHGARFNLKTGVVLSGPAVRNVQSFRVRVSGEDVEVEID
jgi:3-phenylpropionate/trans-cinnamate dioxygenase ferredoxin subunit